MDTGNREEDGQYIGATLPAHNFGSPSIPSTPRRPLQYHLHYSHPYRYHPSKHEHEHDHDHERDLSHQPTFFSHADYDHGHQPAASAVVSGVHPSTLTTSAAAATTTTGPLDDPLFEHHAARNRDAAHANATTSIEPDGFFDPDDFYRTYINGLMASTLPAPRHNRDASLRSNVNGSTSRHPPISSTRSGLRPAVRSVSAPIDDKPSASSAKSRPAASNTGDSRSGHQLSVKDLRKKFDHNTTQANTNIAHKTPPRIPTREAPWPETNGQASYATLRPSVTHDLPADALGTSSSSAVRSMQRHKAVLEDNLSNSPQSFASRIAKPRVSIGPHPKASKSMNNLSPTISSNPVPPLPQSHGLLFGEIGPGEVNAGFAGHGIDIIPTRRTSESNIQGTLGRRQRSFSHTDAEPSSPSDWYRNMRGGSIDAGNVKANRPPSTRNHSRSRSDFGSTKPGQQRSKTPQTSRPKPTLDTSALNSASKIPISIRKLGTPTSSSSPNSTRSNSPSTFRRPIVQGKKSSTNQTHRAKTPTHGTVPTTKRQHRPDALTPNGNTRLNAYISTPPPKLSPTLRSSRPRQPVSAATTTSSRMRAVERDKSPGKRDARANTRGNDPATRRRKISMGPIDFESRREQIKLSYTKSLRENEARAIARRLAQDRKKKEEAEALAAQVAAAEVLKQQEENLRAELTNEGTQSLADAEALPEESLTLRTITSGLMIESPADVEAPTSELPSLRTITTGLLHDDIPTAAGSVSHGPTDSPTLGIPGSFPNVGSPGEQEEAPSSAISNTTEFDAEPQTEPPLQEPSVLNNGDEIPCGIDGNSQLMHRKSEYRSPFEDESAADDSLSIKISLDAPMEAAITEPIGDPGTGQEVPIQDQEKIYESTPLPALSYETKVTILGRDSDFASPSVDADSPCCSAASSESQAFENNGNQNQASAPSRGFSANDPPQSSYEQAEPSTGLSEIEEFFVGPLVKEHQAPLQSFHATQLDGGGEVNNVQCSSEDARFSLESRRTLGTRPSLTVPRTSDSIKRVSQITVWTDYSINSQDSSSGYGPTDQDSQRAKSTWREDLAISEAGSTRSESYHYSRNSRAASKSRDVSPCGTYRESELYEPRPQLPEIDTGEGFGVDILSRKNSITLSAIPVLPDHSPPPPPDDISFHDVMSSAPPSEYYGGTRPNSYSRNEKDDQSLPSVDHSRRESDYFAPLESASRSIDQGSLATSEGVHSGSSRLASQQTLVESINVEQTSDLSAKERKRLFTRLETVKELIDTETFFIRDMNIVEEIYKGTAEACPKLDDKTIKLIFRNTDQIIKFHSSFLVELKEGVSSIYTPRIHRHVPKDTSNASDRAPSLSGASIAASGQLNDDKDRETSLGPIFTRNMEKMKGIHETFLKNSDHAAKRLIQIQEDPTVQVWLNECNEVARELTRAWNLDSLLIKPMQRITKYPNLLIQLLHETPSDHPDRPFLEAAKMALENAIEEINKTKKNFELVGQIVGRKRKESDVKAGFARAFGKRVDKLQPTSNRPPEDAEYLKLHEKFGDDYLRLQVVLRDVEYYTRQVTDYVHEFLQYLSSMELVMRLQPSPHPEIESKWVRFNVSMRDIEKVALEQHLSHVRKQVIEPFELVIKSYSNPSLAMKKRSKRRVDYEKYIQLQKGGKKIDKQLSELVEQYEALNEALKKELPKLSALTEKVGNICLGNFVNIQAQWFAIWKEKVKVVLGDNNVPEPSDIISTFFRDYRFQEEQINAIGIVNPASKGRPSHSTSVDEASSRLRLRPAELSPRHRGLSLNSDLAPSLPTPDFMKRHSGQFTASPSITAMSSPNQFYRDYHIGVNGHARPPSGSPRGPDFPLGSRALATPPVRPGTGQSYDSSGAPRLSVELGLQSRHYSNSVQSSPHQPPDNHRFSGIFQSALPMSDVHERHPRPSQGSSRASSRERQPVNGFNVLWLAASLFEFNIETTKHEAGYPYLTYQAGEIFDVIAEKGELWLAKNQDDPNNLVGWLWSKHFAKLADD
ncbi:hypothetical protein F5Y19DRAFT_462787 [Xylariaceae sp. FL1651]|nr:hypothetical protein F5Y19DRAFT_462787 [Xylariaceae sp. FL1651]